MEISEVANYGVHVFPHQIFNAMHGLIPYAVKHKCDLNTKFAHIHSICVCLEHIWCAMCTHYHFCSGEFGVMTLSAATRLIHKY